MIKEEKTRYIFIIQAHYYQINLITYVIYKYVFYENYDDDDGDDMLSNRIIIIITPKYIIILSS